MDEEKIEVPKEVKEPEKLKDRYELTEVVTETNVAVRDNDTNAILSQTELLVELLNKIEELRRAIV